MEVRLIIASLTEQGSSSRESLGRKVIVKEGRGTGPQNAVAVEHVGDHMRVKDVVTNTVERKLGAAEGAKVVASQVVERLEDKAVRWELSWSTKTWLKIRRLAGEQGVGRQRG
jgi:hypothetical protein